MRSAINPLKTNRRFDGTRRLHLQDQRRRLATCLRCGVFLDSLSKGLHGVLSLKTELLFSALQVSLFNEIVTILREMVVTEYKRGILLIASTDPYRLVNVPTIGTVPDCDYLKWSLCNWLWRPTGQ
jgi:hypothetical protein